MIQFILSLLILVPVLGSYIPIQTAQIAEAKTTVVHSISPILKSEIVTPLDTSIVKKINTTVKEKIPSVPFYSQFTDIVAPEWKKVSCGVVSLAMIIDYYKPGTVSTNTLLKQGIANGAYLSSAGWTYKGLISLSNKYDLDGESYDLAPLGEKAAFAQFKESLKDGPVIASIHYNFDPKSTIPHLVVINGIEDGTIYYNDPAAKNGKKTISSEDFLKAWKMRFIVIRPV